MTENSSLTRRYLATGGEGYAYRALANIVSIHANHVPGFNRGLNAGWRTEHVLTSVFGLIESRLMTPEVFATLLKYNYLEGVFLKTATENPANQQSAVDTGFMRICAYLPEISPSDWFPAAKDKLRTLYTGKVILSDYSYMESTVSYVSRVIDEMRLNMDLMAEISGDKELLYFGTGGEQGIEPPTSVMYPVKKIAMLRSSWESNSLAMFINADNGGNHSHPDDLSVDIYAYGANLLVDAGNPNYDVGNPAGYIRTSTLAHNTIEINERAQTRNIGQTIMDLVTNNSFDFVDASNQGYPGFTHSRKVLFIRKSHWIVSDHITAPGGEHIYKQAWHPNAYNNLMLEPGTKAIKTHFAGSPNIQVVPADPHSLEDVRDKSHVVDERGNTKLDDYVYYQKLAEGDQTYDTLLCGAKRPGSRLH